jgi:uncharacterized protein (TIGR00369 family)
MSMTVEQANARAEGHFPGHLGIHFTRVEHGRVDGRMAVRAEFMAPNGFLHAGSVVTLADTCAGFGCNASLPEGAAGYTTVELKSNFLGTARDGTLTCTATLVHGGRSTQVWDATVTHAETGKTLALFRCTQFVLYAAP